MVAKLQHGCGAGLDAQLVFNADAVHVIARTQRAICVDHELGHDKQADALDALWCANHAGQHQMDDVFGHVMLTPGDENLGAKNLEAAIRQWLGTRAHRSQIAAGLRLGQVHGAGPLAADQLFQIGSLQRVGAGGQQRFYRTIAEQRTQRKAHIGRVLHFTAHRANGLGQTLSTKVHRVLQPLPAAFGKLLEGLLETRCCRHHAVFPT